MHVRRFATSTLAGLGLLGATVAWGAFASSFTVLDPDGPERVADALVEEPAARDGLAQALAKALRSGLPPEAQISSAEVDNVARRMSDDPRTRALLRTAIVGAHQRLLGHAAGPVRLDAGAVAQAGREALTEAHPELAASLPIAALNVELPIANLPALAAFRGHLGPAGWGGGLAAVCLLAAAFRVSQDRPGVLRRAGRWAVRVGVSSAAIGGLLPYLTSRSDNPRIALVGALVVAVEGRIVIPALALAAAGTGAIVVARAWRRVKTARFLAREAPPTANAAPPPIAA
jgi:hypothetical protein